MILKEKPEEHGEKPCQLPLCPLQIIYRLSWRHYTVRNVSRSHQNPMMYFPVPHRHEPQTCGPIKNIHLHQHEYVNQISTHIWKKGRDSSVGIATRNGLDGPGIESRWEARYSAPVQTGPGAQPASYTTGTGSFPGVKRPGRCADHPPPSSAEVKERV